MTLCLSFPILSISDPEVIPMPILLNLNSVLKLNKIASNY